MAINMEGTGDQARIPADPAVAGGRIPADKAEAGLSPDETLSPDPTTAEGQAASVSLE